MGLYARPNSIEEALALLAQGRWHILAGATDFYPAHAGHKAACENVLDINGLPELCGIEETSDHVVIGARTRWSDIVHHPLPGAFEALKGAGRELGSVQIQNVATLAGNLCNASPAADGVPALLVLGAEVELRSARAIRHLPLDAFILANRRTALEKDELMTAIRVPKSATGGRSAFVKLGSRRYLVISIAMVAARIALAKGKISEAAIAVGACSEVAARLPRLEAALIGRPADGRIADAVQADHFEPLAPIDDVRGTADYRRAAAREITLRALVRAIDSAPAGEAVP